MENEEKKPPAYPEKILNTYINTLFFNNFSHISERLKNKLKFNIYHSLNKCEELWRQFSPNESLFDLWEFRYQWYLSYQYVPYFITIEDNVKPIALFPLWFDSKKNRFEWFGSDWMEDNRFFVEDDQLIDVFFRLLSLLPIKIYLNAILPNNVEHEFLLKDTPKYVLNLREFSGMDQFLTTLEKKIRYKFKKDYLEINSLNPKIIFIEKPNENDLYDLKKLSSQRFNGVDRDTSDLKIEERFQTYLNIIKSRQKYKTWFLKVYVKNYLAVVDMIIIYNNIYYPLKGANDVERFSGIGNFINYFEIKYAIENNYSKIDFLQGDYNWKHYYLKEKSLLKYQK